jgi:hypothetical protein
MAAAVAIIKKRLKWGAHAKAGGIIGMHVRHGERRKCGSE